MTWLQVFFRAGVLGTLEDIRDDRLTKVVTCLQAWVRGHNSRRTYRKLQEQRVALIVVQSRLRQLLQLRNWSWSNLWQNVKPLLNITRIEDEMRELEEKLVKSQEDYERELKIRREMEMNNVLLLEEKNSLIIALEAAKGDIAEFLDKQAKLLSQKVELETQLNVSSNLSTDKNPVCFMLTNLIIQTIIPLTSAMVFF